MTNLRELLEFDPAKKTGQEGYDRARKVVRQLRQSMRPIVDSNRAGENKKYLFGMQDMTAIKEMFKNPEKAGVKFWQLSIMEKIRNVLISEEENQGISFQLKASDTTATNQKQKDREMIQARSLIESTMSSLQKMIGLPAYKMSGDKDENGRSNVYNGNVTQFDDMGLDPSQSEDVSYFMAEHYRLLHEIVGEEPINAYLKYNEVDEMTALMMNDIMSVKACAMRVYVNDVTGMIDYKYVAPENILALRGRRRDFKDAGALAYEQSMSVTDWIKLIGSEFDYDRDMLVFMQAINSTFKSEFTGIMSDGNLCWGTGERTMEMSDFLQYHVKGAYIEWKEIDAVAHKVSKVYKDNGIFRVNKASVYGVEDPESLYKRDVRYYETTYKAYYLATSNYDQQLYKYGKLNYQMIDGTEDEYSNYSICVSQEKGKAAVEVAMPYIEFIEKCFKKFEVMVVRAKPPGRGFNYESLYKMAEALFPTLSPDKGIDQVIRQFMQDSNELFTIPTVNGLPIGGGGALNYDIPHGLSKTVMEFKAMIDWGFQQILDQLGISPFRAVYQPGERDGFGVQNSVNNNSLKATQYMHRMMMSVMKNVAKRTLSYTQDIIMFKDKNNVPYKAMLRLLGDRTVQEIEMLGKVCFHRYGITVEGLNLAADKQEQKAIAQGALQKGQIDYEQWVLINSIDSPKKANIILAYEKKRKERLDKQAAQQSQSNQVDLLAMQHKNKMEEIQLEGQLQIKRENVKGYWYSESAKIAALATVNKAQMQVDNEPEQMRNKINAEVDAAEKTKQLEQQQAQPV